MSLLELFCDIDDFCQEFYPHWEQGLLTSGMKQQRRVEPIVTIAIMTLLVHFYQMHFRDFKTYYTAYVRMHLRSEFASMVS